MLHRHGAQRVHGLVRRSPAALPAPPPQPQGTAAAPAWMQSLPPQIKEWISVVGITTDADLAEFFDDTAEVGELAVAKNWPDENARALTLAWREAQHRADRARAAVQVWTGIGARGREGQSGAKGAVMTGSPACDSSAQGAAVTDGSSVKDAAAIASEHGSGGPGQSAAAATTSQGAAQPATVTYDGYCTAKVGVTCAPQTQGGANLRTPRALETFRAQGANFAPKVLEPGIF